LTNSSFHTIDAHPFLTQEGYMKKLLLVVATAALNNITDNWTCVDTTVTTCTCPGGGTVVFSGIVDTTMATDNTQTAIATECTDKDSGLKFDGEMQVDMDTGSGTMDFDTFGQCTDVEGNIDLSSGDCSGTATGTCQEQALNCEWVDGPDDDCICKS
jgi:hypothetical protein